MHISTMECRELVVIVRCIMILKVFIESVCGLVDREEQIGKSGGELYM